MPDNRTRLLDAAIELIANGGMHALTHLKVAERAGLPKGATSNVFRTRDALVIGVCEHMVAREVAPVTEAFAVRNADELADSLHRLYVEITTGRNRTITLARLALFEEAGHNEAIRAALTAGRSTFAQVLLASLAALGAPDPRMAGDLLIVTIQGLFVQHLQLGAAVDPKAIIAAAVRSVLPARTAAAADQGT